MQQLLKPNWGIILPIIMLCVPIVSWSQITITADDLLGLVGTQQVLEEDTTGTLVVDLGQAGANQSYDFTADLSNGFLAYLEYVPPSATPYASLFGNANLTQKLTAMEDGDTFTIYLFLNVEEDHFSSVGSAIPINIFGFDTTLLDFDVETVVPLPIEYGDSWTTVVRDTIDFLGSLLITVDSTVNEIDAWGKVQLPEGEFDCLRMRQDNWEMSNMEAIGREREEETVFTISYIWLTKASGLAAIATSQDNETDPGFNNPSSFNRLRGGSTTSSFDVADIKGVRLLDNYPNPFRDETNISFELDVSKEIDLDIIDVQGRQVRQLMNGRHASGSYTLKWDGKNDNASDVSAGTYFLSMTVDGRKLVKKLTVVN